MYSNELSILRAAPLAFLSKYSVSPDSTYGGSRLPANKAGVDVNAKEMRRNPLVGKQGKVPNSPTNDVYVDTLLTIEDRSDKIAYGLLTGHDGDHYQLKFYAGEQLTKAQKEAMLPMWVLPWQADHITSLRIPPPNQHNLGWGPSIFFTSALSGCSVFVKGTSTSPTIYHAGTAGRNFQKYPKRDPDSARHWKILFDEMVPNAPNVGEANMNHYLADAKDNPHLQVYLNHLKSTTNGEVSISEIVPEGTVFGIRDDSSGRWTIYLQEKVSIRYTTFTINKKFFGKDERIESAIKTYKRPMCIREIFPNGAGSTPSWNLEPVKF